MQTIVFLVSEFPVWALVSAAVLMAIVVGAPVAVIVLWLSRRYGAPARPGGRELRIVRTRQTRVYGARRRAAVLRQREGAGVAPRAPDERSARLNTARSPRAWRHFIGF